MKRYATAASINGTAMDMPMPMPAFAPVLSAEVGEGMGDGVKGILVPEIETEELVGVVLEMPPVIPDGILVDDALVMD
jgi:hypothetical protein